MCNTRPVRPTTVATVPAAPASPNGLSMGGALRGRSRAEAGGHSGPRVAPATAATTTTRQRRERSRPSGTSRAGRVIPRATAGAQMNSPATARAGRPAAAGGGRGTAGRPRVPGDHQRPDQPGGGVQPADRVGRPPQAQDQPDGGVAEREGQRVDGPLGQHGGRERPGHGQGDHQPGGAAAEGGQPQRPGEHGPGPGLQPHRLVLGAVGLVAGEYGRSAVRDRYGPDRRQLPHQLVVRSVESSTQHPSPPPLRPRCSILPGLLLSSACVPRRPFWEVLRVGTVAAGQLAHGQATSLPGRVNEATPPLRAGVVVRAAARVRGRRQRRRPARSPRRPPLARRPRDAARDRRAQHRAVDPHAGRLRHPHTLSSQDDPERGIGAARDWLFARVPDARRDLRRAHDRRAADATSSSPRRRDPGADARSPTSWPRCAARSRPRPGASTSSAATTTRCCSDPLDAACDAPGANDDASGVAAVLEMARVMAKRHVRRDDRVHGRRRRGAGPVRLDPLRRAGQASRAGTSQGMFTNDIVGSSLGEQRRAATRTRVRLFAEGVPIDETPEEAAVRAVGGRRERLARRGSSPASSRRWPRTAPPSMRGPDHLPARPLPARRRPHPVPRAALPGRPVHRAQRGLPPPAPERARRERRRSSATCPSSSTSRYTARVARVNAAALAVAGHAPAAPRTTRAILTPQLTNDTELAWAANTEPDLAGYEVVWRDTTAPLWTHTRRGRQRHQLHRAKRCRRTTSSSASAPSTATATAARSASRSRNADRSTVTRRPRDRRGRRVAKGATT